MIKQLIISTYNNGKLKEYKELLAGIVDCFSIKEVIGTIDIEETGTTFAENSKIKADAAYKRTKQPSIGDDSGLVIDALKGAPGIHSARYAGKNSTQEALISRVLSEMIPVPFHKRTARFVCTIALKESKSSDIKLFTGFCEGYINFEPKGDNGFGYDPIFYLPDFGRTMAEIDSETKNRISHRAKAFDKLKNYIMSRKKPDDVPKNK